MIDYKKIAEEIVKEYKRTDGSQYDTGFRNGVDALATRLTYKGGKLFRNGEEVHMEPPKEPQEEEIEELNVGQSVSDDPIVYAAQNRDKINEIIRFLKRRK